jgi:hypothetical protein
VWITKITLQNVRSFEDTTIALSKGINVLVGPNNAGKSTIAQAVLSIQKGFPVRPNCLRSGAVTGTMQIHVEDFKGYFAVKAANKLALAVRFEVTQNSVASIIDMLESGNKADLIAIENREPLNFIYPYLSRRKVVAFDEQVNQERTSAVTGNLQYLYAKVDRLSNPEMQAHRLYVDACRRILGFLVTCSSSANGKKACYTVDNFTTIPLDDMGDGVPNVLGLLVDLCLAENKLFVIEEPENDIHPRALKELLAFVVEKSSNNQFIITTHSNIVTTFLGAEPETRIFSVDMEFNKKKVPTSKVEPIGDSTEARRSLLEHLGYGLLDSDLWEGWLFLEEASAEKMIKAYLIPWYVPALQGRLRTFSARSIDRVESRFEDFNRLFCFIHLQPTYRNRAWVIVDGGEQKERQVVQKLKATYKASGWQDDHFQQFNEHDFENYYPEAFKEKVASALSVSDGKARMAEKMALRAEVEAWIGENPERAKIEFEKSAAEVITKLREIQSQMLPQAKAS